VLDASNANRSTRPRARWTPLLLALFPVALAMWFAGWTGSQPPAHADFLWTLLSAVPLAMAWLASAWGFGWAIMRRLAPHAQDGAAVQIGVGVACMLLLDVIAGSLGLLQLGGSIGAWILLLAGLALLVLRGVIARQHVAAHASNRWIAPALWCAQPALAVLLIAACSAPGWLWRTEFGGYDALSYHLQLPREWLSEGSLDGMTHNVYSFLPSFMEAAYYHLAVIQGDAIHAAYACQLLHASMAVLAAWIVGALANRLAGPVAGGVAMIAFLGTPWVIVTGTLAYNEMATTMLLAAALLLLRDELIPWTTRGALAGLLAGAACGAKLTSIGFVAFPCACVALLIFPRRRLHMAACCGFIMFAATLAPYLIRNAMETGNPVFPFACNIFGLGHWTAEQAAAWSIGHDVQGGLAARCAALWNQFLRFGIGPNPSADEPWIAQWSILPWLGVIGLCVTSARGRFRSDARRLLVLLVVQLMFWMFFTHAKSRFMLPAVVPLAIGVGLAAALIWQRFSAVKRERSTRALRIAFVVTCFAGLAWCAAPVLVFMQEPGGMTPAPAARVGRGDLLTGDLLSDSDLQDFATLSVAYALRSLPKGSHTLLIGDAAPFYIRSPMTYQTTWDRGPMSLAIRAHPDAPEAWSRELLNQGFTHVYVEPGMLTMWERAGWNDPLLTADRILSWAEHHAEVVVVTPTGVLFQLRN